MSDSHSGGHEGAYEGHGAEGSATWGPRVHAERGRGTNRGFAHVRGAHGRGWNDTIGQEGWVWPADRRRTQGHDGIGAVLLPVQYDSQHLKLSVVSHATTCTLVRVAAHALLGVENPWAGHFKEHRS